jgi:hypothetical protein
MKLAHWAILVIALIITSGLVTDAAFWVTGRGGHVPCGEDGWRWGLMYRFVGIPMLLCSFFGGLSFFTLLRNGIRKAPLLFYVCCFQFIVALLVLVMLTWPEVIYRVPLCE